MFDQHQLQPSVKKIMPFLLLLFAYFGCNNPSAIKGRAVNVHQQSGTAVNSYEKVLTEKENAAANADKDSLGVLIATITFNVKASDKTEFETGFKPWANIGNPEQDIANLADKDKIVIPESKITVIIDYPLTNEYRFGMASNTGFTRAQLLRAISKNYHHVYAEEENTATIKTIPVAKRKTLYNRNETNGKYGIWGHDIEDLALSTIWVYKTIAGQIILSLEIDS